MDYEKRYKEIIEAVRNIADVNHSDEGIQNWVKDNFPEIQESEDEKIRKVIVELVKCNERCGYSMINDITTSSMLSWLEKQCDKDKLIKELGEYKVKYTQEVLEKCMSNKDDERLRKTTIDFLKEFADKGYENAVECIDWLEKQGESKSYSWKPTKEQYEALDYAYNSCSDTERGNYYEGVLETLIEDLHRLEDQGEQKHIDKLEPKFDFKVGQWIVATGKCVYLISKIDGCNVTLVDTNGDEYVFDVSSLDDAHQWTISDAKPGDVLVGDKIPGHPSPFIAIFKMKDSVDGTFSSHCFIGFDGNFYEGEDGHCSENLHPATKEQRDILFKAMDKAGYTFDSIKYSVQQKQETDDNKQAKELLKMLLEAIDYSFAQIDGTYDLTLTYPVIDKVKYIKQKLRENKQ